jgi:hypothetical protein
MLIDEELKNGVALIFRRKAKDLLTDREFVFSASMDLRWFSYTDAMRFLELAVASGLVRREGKTISPTFDHRKMELPATFKPSAGILGEKPGPQAAPAKETVFLRLVDAVGKKNGEDRQSVISRINKKREQLDVDAEVLALLAAKEAGIDIAPFLDEAEALVKERIGQRTEDTVRDEKEEE